MRYYDPQQEIRKCRLLSPILPAKSSPPFLSTNMPLKMSPKSGQTMSVGSEEGRFEPLPRLAKLEPRMLCPIHNHSNYRFVNQMDILLLGCYSRFSCSLIK